MSGSQTKELWNLLGGIFKSHPWHGVKVGKDAPRIVTAYIEVVPTDTVKYEIDKSTGYLIVDRPQKFSNVCPTLYGFIPQTYCAKEVAEFCNEKLHRTDIEGDGDPLDICVLTEKVISHSDILLHATPIGGLRMIDGNEADDKIIAVMKGDAMYGRWTDIEQCPPRILERLRHYFLTYKDVPGQEGRNCEITHTYDSEEAHEVIRRAQRDYHAKFSEYEEILRAYKS
ncbi:MAG: inorganic pyrophosphatase [Deferribacteres bacterium]|nr:inorganic pyrophosphatase [candidate division KSB1 bacterium]MCB9501314.1 inorganic pyrophosphatase [Deferribacteres bacterium]